LLKSYLVVKTA